jgi:hypothetical protein
MKDEMAVLFPASVTEEMSAAISLRSASPSRHLQRDYLRRLF